VDEEIFYFFRSVQHFTPKSPLGMFKQTFFGVRLVKVEKDDWLSFEIHFDC